MKIMSNDILEDNRCWKGKFKVEWCELCDTAIIVCPEENCTATSCNCTSCEKCHEEMLSFSKVVKVGVYDYLTDEEIEIYRKARRLKEFILYSIHDGDKEIDWLKLQEDGRLCQNDLTVFQKELAKVVKRNHGDRLE